MQVTTDDFLNALEQWVKTDLLSKGNGWQKAGAMFVFLQGKERIRLMLNQLNALSDDGKFDVDILHDHLNQALSVAGNSLNVPLLNYQFDKVDLDKVFTYLKGQ